MWDWTIWGALTVSALAAIGTGTLLVVRSLDAWRGANAARTRLVEILAAVAEKAEKTTERLEATAAESAELEESVSRLRVSLARLAVLRAAIGEAEAVIPRA